MRKKNGIRRTLKKVRVSAIKPNRKLLKTEEFQKDLKGRIERVKKAISEGKPLPPLILRNRK